MKKIVLILSFICILFSSCEDNSIKYNGPNTVNVVLQDYFDLNATSNDPIQYQSDNELYVTVSSDGVIYGKNIGKANITLSNTENELTIPVNVNLFEEPTINFGASTSEIKALYGEPKRNFGDSIFIYGSGQDWYSPTVWEMDFFFNNDKYYEANLYIRKDLDLRLNQFLDENYYYYQEITDTINEEKNLYIYFDTKDPRFAEVVIGKQYHAGPYNDILIIYAPAEAITNAKMRSTDTK